MSNSLTELTQRLANLKMYITYYNNITLDRVDVRQLGEYKTAYARTLKAIHAKT